MNSKREILLSVFIFLILFFMLSCTAKVKETRFVTKGAIINMIIAADSSDYKDRIRGRLVDRYKDRFTIEIVNINKLKEIRSWDYDVILIMDTTMGWSRFNKSLKSYLTTLKDRKNVVLFMTADDTEWEFSYKGVDAITAASNTDNEEIIFWQLTESIDKIVAEK